LEEASAGDPEAAKLRLQALNEIPEIEITEEVEVIAKRLLSHALLPSKAKVDYILPQQQPLVVWTIFSLGIVHILPIQHLE